MVFMDRIPGKTNYSNQDYTGIDVSGEHFADCNFSLTGMVRADLNYCTFENCNLEQTRFNCSNMTQVRFENCKMRHTIFNNANLQNATFINCEMVQCLLNNANLAQSIFDNCKMPYCFFAYSSLEDARFLQCNLSDAVFSFSILRNIQIKDSPFPVYSYQIIGELLRQQANYYRVKEIELVGIVMLKTMWCWSDFAGYLQENPSLIEFARNALSSHECLKGKIEMCEKLLQGIPTLDLDAHPF